MKHLLRSHLLTLGEEGSGGGTGGGPPAPTPEKDPGEAPRPNPREAIYAKMEADSVSKATAPVPGQPATGTPSPPSSGADSEGAPKGPEDPVAEKRIRDAQAALHRSRQELAAERKAKADLEAKISLVSKYVDWDKLTAWEQQQAIKRLDEPVTVRDLQGLAEELKKTPQAPAPTTPDGVQPTESPEGQGVDFDFNAYLEKHDFLIPYAKSGEIVGVAANFAKENPDLSMEDLGEKVAEHFANREKEARKRIEAELTRSREALGSAGTPRASFGMPDTEEAEAPVDTSPAAEVSVRQERLRRQRTFQ